MTLSPDICCKTCQLAASDEKATAADMTCTDCAARYVMRTIQGLGKFGGKGHAKRIEDRVFDLLAKERK